MNELAIWTIGYMVSRSLIFVVLLITPIMEKLKQAWGQLLGASRMKLYFKEIPSAEYIGSAYLSICGNSFIPSSCYNFNDCVKRRKEEIEIILSRRTLLNEIYASVTKPSSDYGFVQPYADSVILPIIRALAHRFKAIFLPAPCLMGRAGHFGFHSPNCSTVEATRMVQANA